MREIARKKWGLYNQWNSKPEYGLETTERYYLRYRNERGANSNGHCWGSVKVATTRSKTDR